MKIKFIIILGVIAISYFYVKDIKMEQPRTIKEIKDKIFYGREYK